MEIFLAPCFPLVYIFFPNRTLRNNKYPPFYQIIELFHEPVPCVSRREASWKVQKFYSLELKLNSKGASSGPLAPISPLPARIIVIEYSQRWALCIGNTWTAVVVRPEEAGTKADPTFLPPPSLDLSHYFGRDDRRNRKGEFVHHRNNEWLAFLVTFRNKNFRISKNLFSRIFKIVLWYFLCVIFSMFLSPLGIEYF